MAKKKTVEEVVVEQTETITEEVVVVVEPKTHTVSYGETWVSIAELYKGKASNNSYAKKLTQLNSNKPLTNGTTVYLP
jgi:hypothetical protein